MTRTTLITCDVCKKEITQNPMTFSFVEKAQNQTQDFAPTSTPFHDICEKCFTTQTVTQIINSLLANRNSPYNSWSITFEGLGWKFEKKV